MAGFSTARAWTQPEDALLLEFVSQGKAIHAAAKRLKRSAEAAKRRYYILRKQQESAEMSKLQGFTS